MRRSIHQRNGHAAFYVPSKLLKDWKYGDKIMISVDRGRICIKKTNDNISNVMSLTDGRRFIILPISFDKVAGKFLDLKQVDNDVIIDIVK